MNRVNDRIRAKRLLDARKHGFKILPFLRHRAVPYAFYAGLFATILFLLALSGLWFAFDLVVSFLAGILFVYVRWLRGQRKVWPFAMKIINWDAVQKFSEDEPSA